MKQSDDQSIFAWVNRDASPKSLHGLMATSPANFAGCSNIIPYEDWVPRQPYSMTNRGLQIALPLTRCKDGLYAAFLDCPSPPHYTGFVGIFLKRLSEVDEQYARVKVKTLAEVHDPGPTSTIYVRQTIKSEIEGLYPKHCIQLRSLPPLDSPYWLTNVATIEGRTDLTPCPILSTRDNQSTMSPRHPKSFLLDKTANSPCVGIVFSCPRDISLYIVLGSDANFGVGFNVIEVKARSYERGYPQYQPLAAGTWVTLEHHMVHVTAESRVRNSTKYFMVDIKIQEVERPRNPLQRLTGVFQDPSFGLERMMSSTSEGTVRKEPTSEKIEAAKPKFWRRMMKSNKSEIRLS